MCQMSRTTYHVSHVFHMSHFFFFFKKNLLSKGEASWWRVCYQRAYPVQFVSIHDQINDHAYFTLGFQMGSFLTAYQPILTSTYWLKQVYRSKMAKFYLLGESKQIESRIVINKPGKSLFTFLVISQNTTFSPQWKKANSN